MESVGLLIFRHRKIAIMIDYL